jgi:hypothetical protein
MKELLSKSDGGGAAEELPSLFHQRYEIGRIN